MTRIVVEFINPPIPARDHDYAAYDMDVEDSPTGYGTTREEALNHFVDLAMDFAYDKGFEDGQASK